MTKESLDSKSIMVYDYTSEAKQQEITHMGRQTGTRKIDGVWYTAEQIKAMGIVIADNTKPAKVDHNTNTPMRGIHVHSHGQVQRIEKSTDLIYGGSFCEGHGSPVLVPVFFKNTHTEDEIKAMIAAIRTGN